MKHFNQAHIYGALQKVEEKKTEGNNKPYIELTVNCHGPYGRVLVFGRLWGKAAAKSFKSSFREGSLVHLTGALAQYEGRNKEVKSNFSFYRIEGWDPYSCQHMHRRATFILVGDVVGYKEFDTEGRLSLKVVTEHEGQAAEEKTFEIMVPLDLSLDFLSEYSKGSTVRVKGRIRQEEDDAGDVTVYARPLLFEIKINAREEAPF